MLDVKELINHIDVQELLERYDFSHVRHDGVNLRSACKLHDGDNPTAFVINKETGLWYCHTGCGGGDVYTLVQKLESVDFMTAVKKIANMFNIDISNMNITVRGKELKRELKEWMAINKHIRIEEKPKECPIVYSSTPMRDYRGFKQSTLSQFEVGNVERIELINKSGEVYTLKDRIVFPIYFDGLKIGFSLRRVNDGDIMKWSHQPRDVAVGKLLYNYDSIIDEVVVCEGILDVMAFHEVGIPAVCTFGAHMSSEQRNLLLKLGCDITLCYDADDAGRKATQHAVSLLKGTSKVYEVQLPNGTDPESIPRTELLHNYLNKRRIA